MFRAITVTARLVLGALALSLAALLSTHLPGGPIPAVSADATFVVDSTGDEADAAPGDGICEDGPYFDGPGRCTLRAAIEESNASPGHDTISFEIASACIDFDASTICQPGGEPEFGVQTISPRSPLPAITDPVAIDGTTQPGYSGQPLIQLDGTNVGESSGLSVGGSYYNSTTIRGLAISGFPVYGIGVVGGKAIIQGNVIESNGGPDRSGRPRGGIYVDEGGATIGGTSPGAANVIALNRGHGIVLGRFSGATISGNSIYDNVGQGIFLECRRLAVGPCGTRPDHIPAITSVERVGDSIVVRGINLPDPPPYAVPQWNVTLEFFASRTIDPSGYGEGEIFLGARNMAGLTFEETFPAPPVGCIITMTGTTFHADSSSFSRGVLIGKAPGVITVNSAADPAAVDLCGGPCAAGGEGCTLREAIDLANATPGTDTIAFDIGGPRTITLNAPLPTVSDPLVIDGTTQPGFSGKPLIELDGSLAGRVTGLDLRAGHSVVRGLVINRFFVGIAVGSGDNTIQGNFIGTDPSGTIARGNEYMGVSAALFGLWGSPVFNNNLIGGTTPLDRNLISGNGWGVRAWRGSGVRLLGNFIGTDYSGTKSLANAYAGVWADGVTIGGPGPGEGNLISGNSGPGIAVEGGTEIVGNKIGTTANGKKPLGNGGAGIIDSSGYGWVDVRDNIIAYNGTWGINAGGGAGNLLRNSIHSNGAEGLVMYSDPDYPTSSVVESASRSRGGLTVSGSARSVPEADLQIELFASEACDPSGYGEGQLPLGSVAVTANTSGDASFTITVDAPAHPFQYVTATVTTSIDGYPGYTSSFSNCLPISPP